MSSMFTVTHDVIVDTTLALWPPQNAADAVQILRHIILHSALTLIIVSSPWKLTFGS